MNFFSDIELSPLSIQILSALPAQIAIVDNEGVLVAHNSKWAQSASQTQQNWVFPLLGENILQTLQQPLAEKDYYALQLIMAYKSVLRGEKESVTIRYEVKGEREQWMSLTISSLEEGERFLLINEDITADINAKKALREHNQRFQKQFENKLYGIVVTDRNLKIKEINQTACRALNCDNVQVLNKSLTQFLNIPVQFDPQNRVDDFDEIFLGESELTTVDGLRIPVDLNITMYTTPSGEKVINCIFRDITSKNEAKNQLELEQSFMEASVNSLPTAFFVIDEKGKLIRWNHELEKEFGYTPQELKNMEVTRLVHPSDLHHVWPLPYDPQSGKTVNIEIRCITKSGNNLYYMISGKSFYQNGRKYIVGGGVNRSDFKKVESQSHRNEMFFTQLFEKSQLGMVLLNREGQVVQCNSRFEGMMGYTQAEVFGKKLYTVITPQDQHLKSQEYFAQVLSGNYVNTETTRIRKDGTEIPIQLSSIPVTVDDEVIAAFGVYVDLTAQAETQQIISEQLKEREILIQEIHHRVKNNMAIISGIIELESMHASNNPVREHLQKTQSRIHSISRIHEVMYKNRNLTSINFADYMVELAKNFRNQKLVGIHFDCDPDIVLNVNQAIPCGMLINEITEQVINHSEFVNEPEYRFGVKVDELENHITINISHNSAHGSLEKIVFNESLSGELVSVLLKQLECETRKTGNEQSIEFSFEMNPNQRGAHNALL